MSVAKTEITAIGILLLMVGIDVYFYPQMPEKMATHWNIHGQVDGYMSKTPAMFIMPGILTAIVASLIVIPRVVSVSANIEGFRKFYGGFVVLFSVFILLVEYHTILWNLGIEINPLVIVFGIVPAFIGWMAVWFYLVHRKKRTI
jgi:uncharacterized membrane protein